MAPLSRRATIFPGLVALADFQQTFHALGYALLCCQAHSRWRLRQVFPESVSEQLRPAKIDRIRT